MDGKKTVFIVDDEIRIRRMLSDYLKSKGYAVIEACDGREAMDVFCANNLQISMILLDVMMPVKSGYEFLREIREFSDIPVIMLTAKGEEYDQLNYFKNGADDFVAKPFSPALLLAHIEAVMKRCGKTEDGCLKAGNITMEEEKRKVMLLEEEIELTPKEYDLLAHFIHNEMIVMTRETIVDAVWNYDYMGDIRTVDTHVKQLRAKLKTCGSYIKTVHGVGYRFEVADESIN